MSNESKLAGSHGLSQEKKTMLDTRIFTHKARISNVSAQGTFTGQRTAQSAMKVDYCRGISGHKRLVFSEIPFT
jgi:hypothetical protein